RLEVQARGRSLALRRSLAGPPAHAQPALQPRRAARDHAVAIAAVTLERARLALDAQAFAAPVEGLSLGADDLADGAIQARGARADDAGAALGRKRETGLDAGLAPVAVGPELARADRAGDAVVVKVGRRDPAQLPER